MSDYSELKRMASLAKNWSGEIGEDDWYTACCFDKPKFSVLDAEFIAKCEPGSVLALIAEVEGLRAQHGRDSAELRSLCQARDDARKDRDQLKAEVERLKEEYDKAWRHDLNDKNNVQVLAAEVAALRKDADRFIFIEQDASSGMSKIYGDDWVSVIDSAMSKGAKP